VSDARRDDETVTPTWVKAFAGATVALIVVVLLAMFAFRGAEHGPQRHGPGGIEAAPAVALLAREVR
jgi:hypothetical protein